MKNTVTMAELMKKVQAYGQPQNLDEGFASDAQRRAAFAQGYKAKGKKDKKEETLDEKLSTSQIATLKKTFEPLRGKKIGPNAQKKLMQIRDKLDRDKYTLGQLVKADIPFVTQLAITRLISKHNMKAPEINKLREETLDEKMKYTHAVVDNNGNVVTAGVSLVTTNTPSYGGDSIESVSSIKKYAPAIYASQNRAVTANDYESLIPKIYAETQSVSAYGGEDLNPPAYGKVFISIKPEHGEYLSTTIKQNIKNSLRQYSVTGIQPEIVDLKYLYVEADSYVYYNTNLAPSPAYVSSVVRSNLEAYSNSVDMNKFGARFKYSKYLRIIDDSHESVTSNITNITMRRDMAPVLNTFTEYEICYGNRFHIKNEGGIANRDGNLIGYNIRSSGFRVSGIPDTLYFGDIPQGDLSKGSLMLFKLKSPSEPVIVKKNVGYVDYVKGEIRTNPINITSTEAKNGLVDVIQISVTPFSNDVIGLQDLYLQLDMKNVQTNMVSDRISSGNDVSGSNYVVSSSHGMNTLVRGTPVITEEEQGGSVQFSVSNRGSRTLVNSGNSVTPTGGTTTTTSSTQSSTSSSSSSSSSSSPSYSSY